DGVPVDAKVALIFCAMNPGFPIPVTTTRPAHARIRSTASEKSPSMRAQSCSSAAASARTTPRAYSVGSASRLRTPSRLLRRLIDVLTAENVRELERHVHRPILLSLERRVPFLLLAVGSR